MKQAVKNKIFKRAMGKRGFTPFRWALRFAANTIVTFAALFATIYPASALLVDSALLQQTIVDVVQKQTGSKLEIDETRFDILRGLTLDGLRLYPPDPSNSIGFINSGPVLEKPLAKIRKIKIDYDILKLFLASAQINAIQMLRPQISITDEDGVTNFSGIIAYREVNFPSADEVPEEIAEEPVGHSDGVSIPAFIPFNPKDLYLPIEVAVKNIGIQEIEFTYEKSEQGTRQQYLNADGLGIDLGFLWKGFDSEIYAEIGSKKSAPLKIIFENLVTATTVDSKPGDAGAPKAAKAYVAAKSTKKISEKSELVFDLTTKFEFANLSKINFDFLLNAIKIETPLAKIEGLKLKSSMRSNIHETLRGIRFDELKFSIADAFKYNFEGDISLPNGSPDKIKLDLDQYFVLDLSETVELLKPFLKNIQGSGRIVLENMKIDGEVEPAKIKESLDARLPFVSARIALEDLELEASDFGAIVNPVNGTVSIALTPALSGVGSQLDSMIDIQMEKNSIVQSTDLGKINGSISDLQINVITRAMYPAMIVPIAKVNVESPQIRVTGKNITEVKESMLLTLDADIASDLSKIVFGSHFEFGKLAEFDAMLDCRNKCKKVRGSIGSSLSSLEGIHAIAYPLASFFGASSVMPTSMSGSIDNHFELKGTLPDPLKSDPDTILREGDLRYSASFVVNELNLSIPISKIEVKNFETRFGLNGNMKKQKIDLKTDFEDVKLELPGSSSGKAASVSIKRFSVDTEIKNVLLEGFQIKDALNFLQTNFETRLHLGEVEAKTILPDSLKDLSLEINAEQSRMSSFELSKLNAKMPDYGIDVSVNAKVGIDEEFFPNQFSSSFKLSIDHGGGKTLPGNIKTAGKIRLAAKLVTKDMEKLVLTGKSKFDHFFLTVAGASPQAPNLLVVEDVAGEFPLTQTLDISEMIGRFKNPENYETEKSADSQKQLFAEKAKTGAEKLSETMKRYFKKTEGPASENSNVVAIVDYSSIKPFYPEKYPIHIRKIEAANLELSEIEFDVEVRQNIFALNQFVINFLGGKIQGDFQLLMDSSATDPMKILKSIRTSLHVTRLNSHKLLAKLPQLEGKEGYSLLGSNPFIDASIHLKYDIASSDMGGGVEITSIGKEQLKMMLYFVDPDELDPTIGQIRMALNVGDVRLVSIPIKNGEIGMDVDVRLLGLPIPLPKLSKIPVSQIVRNFTGPKGNQDEDLDDLDFEEYEDTVGDSSI